MAKYSFHSEPKIPPEMQARLDRSKQSIGDREGRIIRCPKCGFRLTTAYGHADIPIDLKCAKCKEELTLNLAFFRTVKMSKAEREAKEKMQRDLEETTDNMEKTDAISEKVYVGVNVDYLSDGRVRPNNVLWSDGRRFHIDKITEVRRVRIEKEGNVGIRFTCMIRGGEHFLFFEENMKWFMLQAQQARSA